MSLPRKTTKSQPILLRSNLTRVIVLSLEDDEYEVDIDDAIHRGYSRPKVEDNDLEEDDLPESIRWRLFLARQLALLKYREIHGQEGT